MFTGEIITILGVGLALAAFNWRVMVRMENRLDGRIDRLESRVDRLESRIERVEQRIDRVEQRLERVEQRLERVEERLDRFEERFDRLEGQLHSVAREFSELRGEIRASHASPARS